jgi:glycerol-3-phosphate dehydrogenase (NAD(P)+)
MKCIVAVLGSGSMGMAVSKLLNRNGHDVKIWSPIIEEIEILSSTRMHAERLPGVVLDDSIECTSDIKYAVYDADVIVMTVPSQTMRENAKNIASIIKKDAVIVSCSKGIEDNTCKIMSEILCEEIPNAGVAVLSGPSFAIEIAKEVPTAVVAASEDKKIASFVQDVFMAPAFRVYTSTDIKGVELGGALKNIIALCAGISDGLGFGHNTKAALITRGIKEISVLGVAMGAKQSTFSGLTGIGDLILTCTGEHSRNRKAGMLIGQGMSTQEALKEVNMVVEGVSTTKPAYEMAKRANITMPIITEAYNILFNDKNPKKAVEDLMLRDKKDEVQNNEQL